MKYLLTAFFISGLIFAQPHIAWVFYYGGPGGTDDEPTGIFCDDSGNVYVPGRSESENTISTFLIKIDSLGRQVWVRSYTGESSDNIPYATARDDSGNTYIAGSTIPLGRYEREDFLLLKYNAAGQLVWRRTYGLENSPDVLYNIDTDENLNIYIAGACYTSPNSPKIRILKYNRNGGMVWMREYIPAGYEKIWSLDFHITKNGNIYIGMTAEHPERGDDWVIVRISPAGNLIWERIYKDTGDKVEILGSSFVDENGNIYLTGEVVDEVGWTDFCTMKIDSLGNILWSRQYNGPENLREESPSIHYSQGNIYIIGRSMYKELGGYWAICVIKYDTLGNELWVRRYGASDTNYTGGSAVTDEMGNVYVIRTSTSPDTLPLTTILLKYDSLGNLVWIRRVAEPNRDYEGSMINFDNRGNMYVVGIATSPPPYSDDIYVIKYRGR